MHPKSADSVSDQLSFLKLDEASLTALRGLKPLVEKHLPTGLDAFYDHISHYPELKRFFSDAAHMERAKHAQLGHWANISAGRFNEAYVRGSQQIGQAHARLGIRPTWYIGGYALVAEHLIKAIFMEVWPAAIMGGSKKKAESVGEAVGALVKAVFFDMDMAISAYLENLEEERRQSEERSAAALANHAAEVDRLLSEISGAVKQTAGNAQQANELAHGTRDAADRGGKVVGQAVEAMSLIEQSSGKISDIIGVIDEIARQTNLLALNAAVEAARAGEAGQGFAVVAAEVRSLAQRSSDAAKDIKNLIDKSNGQVKDGVNLVNSAGAALTEIVGSIKEVATVISAIAAASTQQATSLEQVATTLSHMDETAHRKADVGYGRQRDGRGGRQPIARERPQAAPMRKAAFR